MSKLPVILQVRSSSTRFPNKALREVNGKPFIYWQIMRTLNSSSVSEIVLATSSHRSDDELCKYASELPVKIFRGDLNDVINRFTQIIKKFDFQSFIRLTGDCPLSSPELITKMCKSANKFKFDYYTNTMPPTFPDGLDVEIVNSAALLKLESQVSLGRFREHVTLGFIEFKDQYKIYNYKSNVDYSTYRLTVDYFEDYDFMTQLFRFIRGKELTIETDEIIEVINGNSLKHALGSEYRNFALRKINEEY